MFRGVPVFGYLFFFHAFLVVSIQPANNENIRDGEVRVDSLETCASISCNSGEHCVKRKFWCKHPPCPTMLYCSKTQRESWKGPITCDSVRCSKGYICLVKVRRCHWDQKCRQQIARCVSEREYYDSPASCAGFQCQSGHRCILRESPCSDPPCKLVKDCAKTEDVAIWHNECKNLGCLSEYECFLRKSLSNCSSLEPCKHTTSECTVTNANRVPVNPSCRGWICPKNQECTSLQIPESCDIKQGNESCKITRTCRGSFDTTLASSTRSIPRMFTTVINIQNGSSQTKTSEVEKEIKERTKIDWQKISTTTESRVDLSLLKTIEPFEKSDTISTVEYTGQLEPILDAKHAPTPSRRDLNCNQNESSLFHGNWAAQIEPLKLQRDSIYQTPVYVRSTVKNNITESVEPSCQDQRTDPSITEWLNHLRLKTGVDAVEVWAKHAEKNEEHGQFNEWLESVKSTLGASRFQNWLTEFRKSMSGYPAFQDWLSTIEGITPSVKHEENNEYEATENLPNGYSTLVADYDESSTLRPAMRNESKLNNSLMGSDDDDLIVSVTQRSSNHPSERKNAGHPRINYGLNPRNTYQQKHRGYINSHRNLRPVVQRKNESSTNVSTSNSMQHELTQKEETNTTIPKLGHLIDILKPQNTIERNSSQDYSTDFLTQQNKKNLDSDTRLNYNSTNHSLLLHKTKENVEKFSSIPVGSTVKENRQLVTTKSTLVSPMDLLARSEENAENNTEQDYQVDSVEQNAVRDSQLKNLPSDKTYGVEDSLTRDNEAHISIHELVNTSPESINRTMLQDISVNDTGNPSEKQNLFASVADGLRVTAPLNALRILEPPKKTYYALLRFPQEQVDDQLQIIGYPLILSRTSSIDPSDIFSHTPNLPPNSKPNFRQSKTNSSDSWKQILRPKQILGTVIPQIPELRLFGEKGEQIDSRNQKSLSQQKLVQREPVTFGNSSKFLRLQDERTAQNQHEQNLFPYEEIIPNNRPHQREQLPVISLQSLSASLDPQNPNSRKAYWLVQDPEKPLQNHGDEAIRVKQIPIEQKQKASLDDYPNRRFQQSPPTVQNIDPTSSSFKYWYQREGVTPYQPVVMSRYSSLDSMSLENTPSPLNSANERIGNLEDSFKEYHSDLNLREYLDTYLDAFVKDAVLKLLIGESLQGNETPIGGIKLESHDPFSQNVHGTIIEAIDDKYYNKFPERKTNNPFLYENNGDDFKIPHSVETVQQMNDVLSGELQQATVTPILNPSMSPIVMGIDYQLVYDCEENEKLQLSPTVGIDKSLATGDEYDSNSKRYGVEEYYEEDEMNREYLERVLEYRQAENSENRGTNVTNYYDSHYYDSEK